jgi:glycosyltransferase involved in cell wall biosynthesis
MDRPTITLKIARDAGPKVLVVSSPRLPGEYFSHQRNKGIKAARSDWLLQMDIDERVTPKLRREIQEGIRRTDVDAFVFVGTISFYIGQFAEVVGSSSPISTLLEENNSPSAARFMRNVIYLADRSG